MASERGTLGGHSTSAGDRMNPVGVVCFFVSSLISTHVTPLGVKYSGISHPIVVPGEKIMASQPKFTMVS